jgi:hypothetical protein
MGIKKFIDSVVEMLGIDDFEKTGKKKSIRRLLEQLRARKEALEKKQKKELSKKEAKEIKEELAIVTLQIKKGEKILRELTADKKS